MFELTTFKPIPNLGRFVIEIQNFETTEILSLTTGNGQLFDRYQNEVSKAHATTEAINLVLSYHGLNPQP